jgi:hypothetical protein
MALPKFTAEFALDPNYEHKSYSSMMKFPISQSTITPQARCFRDDLCFRQGSQIYCIEVNNCTGKMLPLWIE